MFLEFPGGKHILKFPNKTSASFKLIYVFKFPLEFVIPIGLSNILFERMTNAKIRLQIRNQWSKKWVHINFHSILLMFSGNSRDNLQREFLKWGF